MHKVRTPWPAATRVQYIVAFEPVASTAAEAAFQQAMDSFTLQ